MNFSVHVQKVRKRNNMHDVFLDSGWSSLRNVVAHKNVKKFQVTYLVDIRISLSQNVLVSSRS